MTQTQLQKLSHLPDWQVREIDKACREVSKQYKDTGRVSNDVFLSFLNVFATALVLVDASTLYVWHEVFLYMNGRALDGDERAKKLVDALALIMQEFAQVPSSVSELAPDDPATTETVETDKN